MSRRSLLILVSALVAGFLAYAGTRFAMRAPAPAEAAAPEAQLAWLAREFRLDTDACAEIGRLQEAYALICEAHCADIAAATRALKSAIAANDAPARAAAEAELARLKQVCADSTRRHLQAVAARMPPQQAARFLALMEPRVAHDDGRPGPPPLAPAAP